MQRDTSCPIPENEFERLQALRSYDILDTPPELEFDALARLASYAFGSPIAVVSMMDEDRLWFKSKVGLDVPQLDRKIAFCAHAIMHPRDMLIVPDLGEDQRFAQNPLVAQSPFIRFYAGAPIVDTSGHALGTIATIDVKPRVFDAVQRSALQDMSTLVMNALYARRRALDLERLALTDYLTGIANRARFEKALSDEYNAAKRTGDCFSVLVMDLDGFKAINDTYGHAAGDEVLCEVARRVGQIVRQQDVFARLGGDEFAVVMRSGNIHDAAMLAARITSEFAAPFQDARGNRLRIGISVGSATSNASLPSAAELLFQADRALYGAKGVTKH